MMPMPQTPSPESMGPSAPEGAQSPDAQGGGGDVKSMLIKVLQKAKGMADSNGLDFEALVNEVMGESSDTEGTESESTAPAAPSPAALQGM
jgi:hypothetical protein